jgi:hypothetical protein
MAQRRAPVEPGEFNRIVRIESRPATDAVDPDSGEPVDGPWTTLVDQMPASRNDILGEEPYKAAQLSAWHRTRWEMHYRSDMDPDQIDVPKLRRLVEFTRTHNIIAASVIGQREGIELITLAKVG